MIKGTGFYITDGKGFHLVFANGWTVSVQFGPGNYCDNYDEPIGTGDAECGKRGSMTAEVACWPHGGGLAALWTGDTVAPRLTANEVAKVIDWVAALPDTATDMRGFSLAEKEAGR